MNAELLDTQGIATILDNDPEPTISISDVTVDEAEGEAVFTVSLSTISLNTITVDWSTSDGTAVSIFDYQSSGPETLTFLPGLTSIPIAVPLVDSGFIESDETFHVDLTNAVGATIADAQGTATIEDDDPITGIQIDDITVDETDSVATFPLTLTQIPEKEIRVQWETNWTSSSSVAAIGEGPLADYVAASGEVVFAPGQTTAEIEITLIDDSLDEADEWLWVRLFDPVNARLLDGSGALAGSEYYVHATIVDDELPTINVAGFWSEEDENIFAYAFDVQLTTPSIEVITVDYAVTSGTATLDEDFLVYGIPASGQLVFQPNHNLLKIPIRTLLDYEVEGEETLFLTLSNPTGAVLDESQAIASIFERHTLPSYVPPSIDIDVDSDNNGFIDETDDYVEATESKLLLIDEQNPANSELAHVQLTLDPGTVPPSELSRYSVMIGNRWGSLDTVRIWDSPTKNQEVSLGTLYPADTFPPHTRSVRRAHD